MKEAAMGEKKEGWGYAAGGSACFVRYCIQQGLMVPWARYKVYIVLKNNQLSEQYNRTICLYSHMMCIQVNYY